MTPARARELTGLSLTTIYRYAATHFGGTKPLGVWVLDAELVEAYAARVGVAA